MSDSEDQYAAELQDTWLKMVELVQGAPAGFAIEVGYLDGNYKDQRIVFHRDNMKISYTKVY